MASINKSSIYLKFEKQYGKQFKKEIDRQIDNQVVIAKQELIEQIKNDDVSQEIAAGPDSTSSKFLPRENLFAFIGFDKNRKPIQELTHFIEQGVQPKESIRARETKNGILYSKQIVYQDLQSIEASPAAQYDGWNGTGNNWIRGVRFGIAGFVNYLYKTVNKFKTSRSGKAIQTTSIEREGDMTPQPDYVVTPLKEFERKIRNVKIDGAKIK